MDTELKQIKIQNKNLLLSFEKYEQNNTNAIQIYIIHKKTYEPYLTLTTNVEDAENVLAEDECLIKTWGENENYLKDFLECGYFEDTTKKIQVSSFCSASVWKIKKQ